VISDSMYLQRILLVDDEVDALAICQSCLQASGYSDVLAVSDSREVMDLLAREHVSLIMLDLSMPHITGKELLPQIVSRFPQIPVILATASHEIETVVECMKSGAFDYLMKPVDVKRLINTVRNALEMNSLSSELSALKQRLFADRLDYPEVFQAIVTGNKKMRALFQYVEVVAGTRHPIMITGETGTGKELVARAVHELSGCKGEFVALNVAGLDDTMFSDTLFGHKMGAFTGADQARDGMIARASRGTLFLDEIGDLIESSQIKLLRLLQEHEYYPVGSDSFRKSDARIVLATNHDLQKLIATGKFRNDLYFRLCAHQIHIPPLRERLDDIPLLLDHFLTASAKELNKEKPTPPEELVILLTLHSFPGNVRELEAMVFDAVARHTSGILSMERFQSEIEKERPDMQAAPPPEYEENALTGIFGHFPTVSEVEEYMIEEALEIAKGNQTMAASLLGISRQTLHKQLRANRRQG